MKRWMTYSMVTVFAAAIGAASMRFYDSRSFDRIVYGPQLKGGVVDPIHAVNHLVVSGNSDEQKAAAIYLINHKNYATDDALKQAKNIASPTARPFIEVGLGEFYLPNYLGAKDAAVRISALNASRFWRSEGKAPQVAAFLSDTDWNVLSQAVYELGEIDDASVLPLLQAKKFDNVHFITEVRDKLEKKAEESHVRPAGV